MTRAVTAILIIVSALLRPVLATESSLPDSAERKFLHELADWEAAKTDLNDSPTGSWVLRSEHFVFGMPRLSDARHDFKPQDAPRTQPGISIVVRESYVAAHFDRMKAPLWVAQRWTRWDAERMGDVASQDRPWQEDLALPSYARGGISYDGNKTELDRGHMAMHAMNRAWGIDGSNWGCKMSNSVPQHKRVNRFSSAWGDLEDEVRKVVTKEWTGIEAVWTIAGAVYRDEQNSAGESPEDDFENVVRITKGRIAVPDATYKIVGWFDEQRRFQARAFVFEQPHVAEEEDGELSLSYDLGNTKAPLADYIVSIDELEERTGVDFFPMMRDFIEGIVEEPVHQDVWGAE